MVCAKKLYVILCCRNVFPGFREVMVAQGTNPFMGTCGTVSWQVVEIDIRYSVPLAAEM